jgi:hypothetical protein
LEADCGNIEGLETIMPAAMGSNTASWNPKTALAAAPAVATPAGANGNTGLLGQTTVPKAPDLTGVWNAQTGQFNLNTVLQQLQQSQDQANKANVQRYNDLLQSISNTGGQVAGTYGQASGLLDTLGQTAATRIGQQTQQQIAGNQQNLVSRGLGNTTIGVNLENQAQQQGEQALQAANEAVAAQKSGVLQAQAGSQVNLGQMTAQGIESLNQQAPNMGLYANMIQQAAAGQQAKTTTAKTAAAIQQQQIQSALDKPFMMGGSSGGGISPQGNTGGGGGSSESDAYLSGGGVGGSGGSYYGPTGNNPDYVPSAAGLVPSSGGGRGYGFVGGGDTSDQYPNLAAAAGVPGSEGDFSSPGSASISTSFATGAGGVDKNEFATGSGGVPAEPGVDSNSGQGLTSYQIQLLAPEAQAKYELRNGRYYLKGGK